MPLKIKLLLIAASLLWTNLVQATPDLWSVLRSKFSMSHEVSRPEVQEQIRWLVAHPSYLQKVCRQSEPYIYHILAEIKKRGLPGELALLPMIESAYNPFAYSGAGAAGLWQLMPGTGAHLGLKQDWWFDGRRSIRSSTDAALNYLVHLSKYFNGNWTLAIAAYDSGEGTIERAVKAQGNYFWNLSIPAETRTYVPRFLALAELLSNPDRYRVQLPTIPYLPYFKEVNIGSQIDLNHAAQMAGISYKELIKLNPGFNRWATAPYQPFHLLIPTGKVQRFSHNLAHMPQNQRISWTKIRTQSGDNVQQIAARYHTTVNLMKQINQLRSNALEPNQTLFLPNGSHTPTLTHSKTQDQKEPFERKSVGPRDHRIIHIVQPKDSYSSLMKQYRVNAHALYAWNHLEPTQTLHPGQQLIIWKRIQAPKEYTVRPGDSLNLIAHHYQTNLRTLLTLNPDLDKNKPLRSGQKIFVA